MKTVTRNNLLALTALAALTIYILACTSFSPDDTKVLYPGVDAQSGRLGIAVYDRQARSSQMAFLPVNFENDKSDPEPPLLRAQFLPDGRSIFVLSSAEDNDGDSVLDLTLLPWGRTGTTKTFKLPGLAEAENVLTVAPVLAGDRFFFPGSNQVLRVDLRSGTLDRHPLPELDQDLALYPSPRGDSIMYLLSGSGDEPMTFGTMNPNTFAMKPGTVFSNSVAEMSFFAYNSSGTRLAFVEDLEDENRVIVLESGRTVFSRPLDDKERELHFGNGFFSRSGDKIIASFQSQVEGETNVVYGIMEIPLNQDPIRETVLIPNGRSRDDMSSLYFQAAVSHDGKAAAVASTYLVCADPALGPADCALFLVDLSDPARKVTKIPVPMPTTRSVPGK